VLNDNVLATFVLCVGHNRYVFMNAVNDFIGNSALSGLVHRQHNTRGLLADELGMGVTVGGFASWPFRFALGIVIPPESGDFSRDHGRWLARCRALLPSSVLNRYLLLRTNSLWGLSDGVVRLKGHLLAGSPEGGKRGLEARCKSQSPKHRTYWDGGGDGRAEDSTLL